METSRIYVWNTEVLLILVYLAADVTIRVEAVLTREKDGVKRNAVKLCGRFEHVNPYSAWYMVQALEARFYIEAGLDRSSEGLAAGMVCGKMADEPRGRKQEEDAESQ